MSPRYSSAAAAAVALLAGIGSAWLVGSRTEVAAADVSRGTEEAFASGLYPRELLPQHGPLRWTRSHATLRFLHVPSGSAHVDVAIAGHRTPVRVVVDGVVREVLQQGEDRVDFQVTVRRGRLDIGLETEGFVASGGRRLGTQLRRVAVTTPGRLDWRVATYFATGSLAVALGALAGGCGAGFAAALGSVMAGVIALTLWPGGVLWSGYPASLWGQVLALALLATLFARWQRSSTAGSGPYAFAAILIAGVVQGIWATHPAMVVSDAVFHANRLVAVAGVGPRQAASPIGPDAGGADRPIFTAEDHFLARSDNAVLRAGCEAHFATNHVDGGLVVDDPDGQGAIARAQRALGCPYPKPLSAIDASEESARCELDVSAVMYDKSTGAAQQEPGPVVEG